MEPAEPPITLVKSAEAIGALVRARRKAAGLTQAQAAGLSGVGTRFFSELERGKKTVALDLVLRVLERVGLELVLVPRGSRLLRGVSAAPQQPIKKARARSDVRRKRRG